MDGRGADLASPIFGQQGRLLIGTGGGGGKSQPLLQNRTQLLMRAQTPQFSNGATPVLIPSILAVPHGQLNDSDDGAQMHLLFSPMPYLCAAEGEKLHLHGWLRPEASLAAVGESTPGLRPTLPFQFRAMIAVRTSPSS